MGSRIRKLGSETAIYGISSVLGRAVNFLLFPFYSHVFVPSEYRPIALIYAAFVFLNILYQYGMESAYLKYASEKNDEERPAVFSSAVWSLVGTAVLFSATLWAFQGPLAPIVGLDSQTEYLLGFAAAILFLDTSCIVPFAELRLSNRAVYFAFVRVISVLVNVSGNLILILVAGMGIEAVLIANVASSATSLVLLAPIFRRNLRQTMDRAVWRQMVRFGLPFLPGGLGYAVSERVNLFFLEGLSTERTLELYGDTFSTESLVRIESGEATGADEVVGIFGGMIKLAILAALGVQMFRYAWQPFFLNHAKDEDAPQLFGRIFTLLTAGIFGLVLVVSFYAAELVAIPVPGRGTVIMSSWWSGLSFIPVALLGYAFQGWYYHFSAGAYIRKKTDFFVVCTLIGSVVALVVNIVAVPRFGMIGAAWATTAAYATMAMCLFVMIQPHYRVPYAWGRVLVLVGTAVAQLWVWSENPALQVWWIELIGVTIYGTVAAVTLRPTNRR